MWNNCHWQNNPGGAFHPMSSTREQLVQVVPASMNPPTPPPQKNLCFTVFRLSSTRRPRHLPFPACKRKGHPLLLLLLTAICFVTIIQAIIVLVTFPKGRDAPLVPALKLVLFALLPGACERQREREREKIQYSISNFTGKQMYKKRKSACTHAQKHTHTRTHPRTRPIPRNSFLSRQPSTR